MHIYSIYQLCPSSRLQPLVILMRSRQDDSDSIDEVHALLERMRTQFQESLQFLEEKWHSAHANDGKPRFLVYVHSLFACSTVLFILLSSFFFA